LLPFSAGSGVQVVVPSPFAVRRPSTVPWAARSRCSVNESRRFEARRALPCYAKKKPRAGRFAVDRIGLGPPMPPGDRDRSRVDHVALDPVGEQQAMNPKPVQSRFLNDDRFDLHAVALLGLRPRPLQKVEQAGAVSTLNHMLGELLAARDC
jgi:hypothetical protein